MVDSAVVQMAVVSGQTVLSPTAPTEILVTPTWQMALAARFLFPVPSWRLRYAGVEQRPSDVVLQADKPALLRVGLSFKHALLYVVYRRTPVGYRKPAVDRVYRRLVLA